MKYFLNLIYIVIELILLITQRGLLQSLVGQGLKIYLLTI